MGNSFGLGLVLTFTDKASAGMAGAIGMFSQLNSAADGTQSKLSSLGTAVSSLSTLGAGLTAAITTPVTAFLSKISNYGVARASFVEDMHLAFTSLMGDAQQASDYMNQLMSFAKTTPYTYEGITSSAQLLISYGIKTNEILDETNGKFGGILQAIGDWAGATGKGEAGLMNVADIIGKINTEGKVSAIRLNQLQLAGIQATNIIGNMYDKSSADAVEFIKNMDSTQFINDLMRGLQEGTDGINGITGAMAGQMMNLKNTWTGAKDTFVSSLKSAGLELMGMYKDDFGVTRYSFLETMTKSLNNLSAAIKKIAPVLQPLVTLVQNAMMRGSEFILKIANAFENMDEGSKNLISKVATLLVLAGPILLVVGKLGGGVLSLFNTVKSMFSFTHGGLLRFAALAGILYYLWTNNIFGIRDKFTAAFGKMKEILSVFHDALDGSLSEESFKKMHELGIAPLVESFLQLRYYWTFFKEGFSNGFKAFFEGILSALSHLKIFGIDAKEVLTSVGNFFKNLLGIGNEDKWKKFGEIAGKIGGLVLVVLSLSKAFKLLGSLGKAVTSPLSLFGGKDSGKSGGLLSGGGILSNPLKMLKVMGSIAIILGGVAILITAIGALYSIQGFKQFADNGFEFIGKLFENLIPLIISAVALSAASALLGRISSPSITVKGFASLAVVLAGFEVLIIAMGALASIPGFSDFIDNGVTTMLSLFESMSGFASVEFFLMLAAVTALGFVGPEIALLGIGSLAIILLGMTAIISAFGALKAIPGFDDFLSGAGDTFVSLFNIMGRAVGAIIGGVAEGVTESLPRIGENIALFAENIKPFFAMLSDAPLEEMGTFFNDLADALLKLTVDELLSFFTGELDLANIGEQLSAFGDSVKPFFDSVAEFNSDGVDKSKAVFDALSSVGAVEFRTGGFLQALMGEVDLGRIGEQLAAFSLDGKTFYDEVAAYSEAGLGKAPDVFKSLAGIGDYDFKTNGLAQLFTGTTSLDVIGGQLAAFAPNGTTFYNEVATYSDAGLKKAPDVFKSLAGIGDYDFKTNGIAQLFTGTTSLDVIGEQLASFAPEGKTFFNTVGAYSPDGIRKSKLVFDALSAIGGYEFKTDGLAQLFTGKTDLANMGSQIDDFAYYAKDGFEEFSTYPDDGISKGLVVFDILGKIGEGNFNSGGLVQLFTGTVDIVSIGEQLSGFASGAKTYFTEMYYVSETGLDRGQKAIDVLSHLGNSTFRRGGLVQLFTGTTDITNLTNNLADFGRSAIIFFMHSAVVTDKGFSNAKQVIDVLSELDALNSVITVLSGDKLTVFGTNLENFGESIVKFSDASEGLNPDNITETTDVLKSLFDVVTAFEVSKLADIASGLEDIRTSTGKFLLLQDNVISGIRTNSDEMVQAVQEGIDSALNILNEFADKGLNIGKTLMARIAEGIRNNANLVQNAAKSAVNSVTSNIVPKHGGIVNKPNPNNNEPHLLGLATGGYVKETGLAVLHPNEVVVNDELTKRLGVFLDRFEDTERVLADSYRPQFIPSFNTPISASTTSSQRGSNNQETHTDNSVTFEQGSVVIQLMNASESELEKAAEKLMSIIARKQQLKAMAVRR